MLHAHWLSLRALHELFMQPRYEELPPRVRATVRRQQAASEVLIGSIQLAIICLFLVLYAISPKTFAVDAPFVPVPVFLGVYLIVTIVRLSLAIRGRLPDYLVYASIVIDIGLLYGLIWSFHLQYDQPATFYLKAPTLLYVFIFIAVRALRLQVRFVALTGLMAAVGWLAMAGYAAFIDEGMEITRDYVVYLTSNTILLGAEVDKIVSILVVTLVLMIAIAQGRRLLVRSVLDKRTADELARFVPAPVVQRFATAAAPAEAGDCEVGEATIMFLDIERFTALRAGPPRSRSRGGPMEASLQATRRGGPGQACGRPNSDAESDPSHMPKCPRASSITSPSTRS